MWRVCLWAVCRLAAGALAVMLGECKVRPTLPRAAGQRGGAGRGCLARQRTAASLSAERDECEAVLQEAARKIITLKEIEPLIEAKYRCEEAWEPASPAAGRDPIPSTLLPRACCPPTPSPLRLRLLHQPSP